MPVRYFRVFPGDAPHGHTVKEMSLDPAEMVLLLVDVYHGAENPQLKELGNTLWDQAWWRIVDENLTPLVKAVRKTSIPVVYVTNSSPRIEIKRSAFGHRLEESLGFDPTVDFREPDVNPVEFDCGERVQLFIPPAIAPRPQDHVIRKHTYSGFFETRLDSLLHNLGARTLLVAGFVADCCVFFTLADAVFRGYNTILLRDCTLAGELPEEVETFHHTERTIKLIESILGPTTTAPELSRALGELPDRPDQG
jgi:nicotinamidase-related amidase